MAVYHVQDTCFPATIHFDYKTSTIDIRQAVVNNNKSRWCRCGSMLMKWGTFLESRDITPDPSFRILPLHPRFLIQNTSPSAPCPDSWLRTLDRGFWPLTTDPWPQILTFDYRPLTANSDLWLQTLDREFWPLTTDPWPPILTIDYRPFTANSDLWLQTLDC